MARRPEPVGCHVVADSTPVVAFGDPRTAEVTTLGINPSQAEFLSSDGTLLHGSARRLATLPSLGASTVENLTENQVAALVQVRQPDGFVLPGRQRLQERGVTFDRYYLASAQCSSSRSVIYTGQHMPITEIYDNDNMPYIRPSTRRSGFGERLR